MRLPDSGQWKKAAAGHVVRQTEPRLQHKGAHYRRNWPGGGTAGVGNEGSETTCSGTLQQEVEVKKGRRQQAEERGREEKTEEGRVTVGEEPTCE